jgi:hypothetical protein
MAWAISCHLIYQKLSMLNPTAGMNVINHVWEPLDSVTKLEALTEPSALKTENEKKNPKMLECTLTYFKSSRSSHRISSHAIIFLFKQ